MKKKWIPAVLAVALVLLAIWGVVRWRNSGADNVAPYTVMVDGALYHTYGEEAPAPEADQISGQISARSAPITNVPRQEGTSNFDECVGQSYAFVHGELLLFYDGRWNYCVHSEDPAWMGIQVMTVMVDGALYHTYGEEAPAPEADEISGQISARFVAGSVLPKEEGTSNFDECVGQPYAFVDGELLLYYGGQWNRCVPAEVHQLDPT